VAATGIVLAGGASTRFGSDKLAVPFDGRPLVHHAVAALATVTTEVIVAIGAQGDGPPLPAGTDVVVPLTVVRDVQAGGGPLAGLLAALERAAQPVALVAAGDMPTLVVDVLRALLDVLSADDSAQAVALSLDGHGEPLPIALRTGVATAVARRALHTGDRSLRALLDGLRTRELEETRWRALDPDALTLRDVDVPGDLAGSRGSRTDGAGAGRGQSRYG
jgi:molybdopterin-guanine dinucleotide biosynthesis protein A